MPHMNDMDRSTLLIEHIQDPSQHILVNNTVNRDINIITDMIGPETHTCSLLDPLNRGRTCETFF